MAVLISQVHALPPQHHVGTLMAFHLLIFTTRRLSIAAQIRRYYIRSPKIFFCALVHAWTWLLANYEYIYLYFPAFESKDILRKILETLLLLPK